MHKFLRSRSREDGFTMIELLVVVIIIAILAAVAVPVYIGIQNNAKRSAIAHDIDTTRLSVAAALAEDRAVTSGTDSATVGTQVLNSKVPDDETITVTIAADGKSFKVVGRSDKLQYINTYNSEGATSTVATGADAVAYCKVYTGGTNPFTVPTKTYTGGRLYKGTGYYQASYTSTGTPGAYQSTDAQAFAAWFSSYEASHHTAKADYNWWQAAYSAMQAKFGSEYVAYTTVTPTDTSETSTGSGGLQATKALGGGAREYVSVWAKYRGDTSVWHVLSNEEPAFPNYYNGPGTYAAGWQTYYTQKAALVSSATPSVATPGYYSYWTSNDFKTNYYTFTDADKANCV